MALFRYCLLFLLLLCVSAGLGWTWLANLSAGEGKKQLFLVQPRDNFPRLAFRLEKRGLIASARAFQWYAMGQSQGPKLGEYALHPGMSNREIVHVLSSGKSILHKLFVPEGYNKFQIAQQLENKKLGSQKRFLALIESPDFIRSMALPTLEGAPLPVSLEGYLYPDTYLINRGLKEEKIIQQMVQRFKKVYLELAPKIARNAYLEKYNLNPHEMIILASIVEKETGAGFERPMIASVFYNRFAKKMRLESDPTTIYGMWNRDRFFKGNIRRKDLREKTPYNTYAIKGLPLGPIANPGRNAIEAVLSPSSSDYLFFVSKNDGTHVFTKNYKEHSKAVKMLQKNPKMRHKKSWRNLPQKLRVKN